MNEVLFKYKELGLIRNQSHPTLPLYIWNYTIKTQFEGLWDEITLKARGLVTDFEGNVVAVPFPKFFNLEEKKHTPTPNFEIFEKLDGSLGILFKYGGDFVFATRGSFISDQALKFKEIFFSHVRSNKIDPYCLDGDKTYLFEIIYPENRIVVDYEGLEDIILLGVMDNTNFKELDITPYKNFGFSLVKSYKFNNLKDYTELKGMVENNHEGYVVKFSNGQRCKIKGLEYIRLHKIMTEVSTTSIWETLSKGDDIESMLENVPDEFYEKIKRYIKDLRYNFVSVQEDARKRFDNLIENRLGHPFYGDMPNKRDYALWVQSQPKHLQHILYKMYNNQSYDDYIWKIVKPKYYKL